MRKFGLFCISLLLWIYTFAGDNYHGYASYYGNEFEGRTTASGDKFTQGKFTCAHRTLPFGTKLKVENLENGKEVIVIVNDRGPFHGSRIIDVSKIAAQQLGMIQKGTANVKIEVID
jgi:rare lipoprotein A